MHDVIIIGAGPAGSVLAYDLAVQGLDVLVLEKGLLPRYKACGGGLTLKTIKSLPFDASETYEVHAQGAYVNYGGRPFLRYQVDEEFAKLVMRENFDYYLTQKAIQAGAQAVSSTPVTNIIECDDGVTVETPKGQYKSRVLAGADGVYSTVARMMGLVTARSTGVAIEAEVNVPPADLDSQGTFATFDFGALPHGYGWIFPKRSHLSIGVFRARPGKATGLRQRLEKFIRSQPRLQKCNLIKVKGHHIPLGGGDYTLHRGRVLLVGDAANLADPWLGEGLYYAINSARMAAQVLLEQFGLRDLDLSQYSAAIHRRFATQFKHARILAGVIYRFPQGASNVLSKSPLLQSALLALIKGEVNFQQMNDLLVRQWTRILLQSFRKKAEI